MVNSTKTQKKHKQDTLLQRQKAVERVITTVSQKLDEPLTIEKMAQMAFLSPFHFSRVFHDVTGLPPAQFLYALRIDTAKRFLLTTDKSVTDICFDVGYNSLGTFTTRFKELVGLSPREFRQLAEQVRSFDWKRLFAKEWENQNISTDNEASQGKVVAPDGFEGLIFIGLFAQMIPQSQPIAGTLLTQGGSFNLGRIDENEAHLLVAALPRAADPYEYLLLDFSKLLVGVGERKPAFFADEKIQPWHVHLRSLQITDPPVLIALPFLIINVLKQITVTNLVENEAFK